ncbi:MAG TPA: radical SAM family heme chaperone HemW [Gemmatimonadaceae bacterium]|nr:radical SAM family heme chaperone HemW [Gemmatimonadaceae bacterium]
MPPNHLYVHVPFCARRCSYCDFSIAVRATTPVDEYLTALRTEIVRTFPDGGSLSTVYLGGGTPSRLGGPGVARLLDLVSERAAIDAGAEITIEANPDDVTPESAAAWAQAGVNRVSLGSQSFDDHVLQWMHRTHDSAQIELAVRILARAGIENLSLDLIFSLPAHLNRSWRSDIQRTLSLEPAHVSLYGLTVESHTPIARWADRGAIVEGTEERYEEEFLYAHESMSAAGFEHYEVSNFARPGRVSRHNSAYWTGAEYAGVGPSAHSFDGTFRRWNVPAYANWAKLLGAGQSVIAGEEELSLENRDAESVYLGLRTKGGLDIRDTDLTTARVWVAEGWAELDGPRLRLTVTGWLRLDSLAADLAARRANRRPETLSKSPSHCYI